MNSNDMLPISEFPITTFGLSLLWKPQRFNFLKPFEAKKNHAEMSAFT